MRCEKSRKISGEDIEVDVQYAENDNHLTGRGECAA